MLLINNYKVTSDMASHVASQTKIPHTVLKINDDDDKSPVSRGQWLQANTLVAHLISYRLRNRKSKWNTVSVIRDISSTVTLTAAPATAWTRFL